MRSSLAVSSRPVAIALGTIVLALFVANVFSRFVLATNPGGVIQYTIAPFFDFDGERTVPAYFSSLLLFGVSGLLFVTHSLADRAVFGVRWLSLSLVFLFMSADEALSFHETSQARLLTWIGLDSGTGIAVLLLTVLAGLLFAAYLIQLLARLPRRTQVLFVLSGLLYVSGVLVIDHIAKEVGQSAVIPYNILMTLEETLEMVGLVVFIYSVIDYNAESVRFESPSEGARAG